MSSNGVTLAVLTPSLTYNGPRDPATAADFAALKKRTFEYVRLAMFWQRTKLNDDDIKLLIIQQMSKGEALVFNSLSDKPKFYKYVRSTRQIGIRSIHDELKSDSEIWLGSRAGRQWLRTEFIPWSEAPSPKAAPPRPKFNPDDVTLNKVIAPASAKKAIRWFTASANEKMFFDTNAEGVDYVDIWGYVAELIVKCEFMVVCTKSAMRLQYEEAADMLNMRKKLVFSDTLEGGYKDVHEKMWLSMEKDVQQYIVETKDAGVIKPMHYQHLMASDPSGKLFQAFVPACDNGTDRPARL